VLDFSTVQLKRIELEEVLQQLSVGLINFAEEARTGGDNDVDELDSSAANFPEEPSSFCSHTFNFVI
jgi:hypothetical protein